MNLMCRQINLKKSRGKNFKRKNCMREYITDADSRKKSFLLVKTYLIRIKQTIQRHHLNLAQ